MIDLFQQQKEFAYIYVMIYKHVFGITYSLLCAILLTCTTSFAQKLHSNVTSFIENKGQIVDQNNQPNTDVLFLYSGKGCKIQLRKSGYSYELSSIENAPQNTNQKFQDIKELLKIKNTTNRVDIDFVGQNSNLEVLPEQKCVAFLTPLIASTINPILSSVTAAATT